MAISLASLQRVSAHLPPRLLIYGQPGIGKTSLAAEFPSPVFLQVEDGTPADTEIVSFGHLGSYADVIEALEALYTEEHEFKTVVLDSLDKLEPLVWAYVCEENKWKDIETPGYGKGYVAADAVWRDLIGACNALRRDRGMMVLLIAHSTVERFDDPTTSSYSRYDIRLHKRALGMIQDEMDAILFLNQDVSIKEEDAGFNKKTSKGKGGGNRVIYCELRPSFVAKNRFGLPDKLPYRRGEGWSALAPFMPGFSESAPPKAA